MRLNTKNLDRLCLGLVVMICVVSSYWAVKQVYRQQRRIQQDNNLITRKMQELDLAKIKSQGLSTKLDRVAEDLRALNEKIPQRAEIGFFLKNVDDLMTSLNLVMINVQPFPAVREKPHSDPAHIYRGFYGFVSPAVEA